MVLSSLHSNMFLLIPNAARYASQLGYAFTFQYVSINTLLRFSGILRSNIFTFQYVSINTSLNSSRTVVPGSLHSNMFLLIPDLDHSPHGWLVFFTFQYVSINTIGSLASSAAGLLFTFQYVSINTFSLKIRFLAINTFTFQYVSINTLL